MVTLQEIKDQISKYLYLTDTDMVDVVLATVVANRMPGDSVSLYLVGPSSSAKTEMIMAVSQSSHVEMLSLITPHSLISGYKDKAGDKEDHSLLTSLVTADKNILLFKDFTTIISMRREDRAQFMAQLRELADGEISAHYGNRPKIMLKAKFGIIAATTNAIDEFTSGILILGERFLKYRVTAEMTDEIAEAARSTSATKDVLRSETSQLVKIFLSQFDLIFQDLPVWDDGCWQKVKLLCTFGAHLRTPIIRDEKGFQVSEVEHEGPGRLTSSICKMAQALALIRMGNVIDLSIYPTIKKIVKDSMPPYRLRIVEMLYESKGCMSLPEISRRLGVDKRTILRYCLELESLKICNRESVPRVKTEVSLAERYVRMIDGSEIFVIDKI